MSYYERAKKSGSSYPVLIVAPHPDDETLGAGGKVAMLELDGHSVHVLVLTDGSQLFVSRFGTDSNPPPGEISRLRKRETERAFTELGGNPNQIRYLDFPDGKLSEHLAEAANELTSVIRELEPRRIYVTSPFEYHPDHRAANTAVKRAYGILDLEQKPDLWEYSVGFNPDLEDPNKVGTQVTVDIRSVLDVKTRAVEQFACHLELVVEGQTEPIWENADQYLRNNERFWVTPGSSVTD